MFRVPSSKFSPPQARSLRLRFGLGFHHARYRAPGPPSSARRGEISEARNLRPIPGKKCQPSCVPGATDEKQSEQEIAFAPDDRRPHGHGQRLRHRFLRHELLPATPRPGLSALLSDLKDRGMLDDTLVVAVGEFGRSPVIQTKGPPGRVHWPQCFFAIAAGCGIRGGAIYGESDKKGSAPVSNPVTRRISTPSSTPWVRGCPTSAGTPASPARRSPPASRSWGCSDKHSRVPGESCSWGKVTANSSRSRTTSIPSPGAATTPFPTRTGPGRNRAGDSWRAGTHTPQERRPSRAAMRDTLRHPLSGFRPSPLPCLALWRMHTPAR